MRMTPTLAALALALALPGVPSAQDQSRPTIGEMDQTERDAFRNEVRAYLLEHPEVIMEAIKILEDRRKLAELEADAIAISSNHQDLFKNPDSWVGGNPDGDVTVVEFLDYRCSYCKRAHPEVKQLLERDPNIRLVVKEFPILGLESVQAAKVATAALELDPAKYAVFNDAMMSFEGKLNETATYQIADSVGYDIAALKELSSSAEIDAKINDTYSLARKLGIEGTPGFVVGDRIIRGYLPVDDMLTLVKEARKATN